MAKFLPITISRFHHMPELDFSKKQEDSRRASRRMMLMFPPAVVTVLLGVSLLIAAFSSAAMVGRNHIFINEKDNDHDAASMYGDRSDRVEKSFGDYFSGFMSNPWFLGITWTITLAAISVSAWAKILELSSEDWITAKIENGTCRFLNSSNQKEKLLFSVVEETAITAGLLAPEVLLLEQEDSINAFITQTNRKRASLFITAGCLERFDREELQAIVAHELSHLINGNLKNDAKIIGLLSGLTIFYELGQDLLRPYLGVSIPPRSDRVFVSPNSIRAVGRAIPLVILMAIINLIMALGLITIGSGGIFAARLIKRVTNRHKVLLADKASIQITRNPSALSRVLLKIVLTRGKTSRSMRGFNPDSISHLCFTDPFGRIQGSLLGTHPALKKRAKAISGE